MQQNHQKGRRTAHAARRPGLPHHQGGTVVHGLSPTEMLYAECHTQAEGHPVYELHEHILENVSMTKYLGVTIQDDLRSHQLYHKQSQQDPWFPPAQPQDRQQEDKENCIQSPCSPISRVRSHCMGSLHCK